MLVKCNFKVWDWPEPHNIYASFSTDYCNQTKSLCVFLLAFKTLAYICNILCCHVWLFRPTWTSCSGTSSSVGFQARQWLTIGSWFFSISFSHRCHPSFMVSWTKTCLRRYSCSSHSCTWWARNLWYVKECLAWSKLKWSAFEPFLSVFPSWFTLGKHEV